MAQSVAPFPKGVVAVLMPIPGTAFFPGGYGIWMEDSEAAPCLPRGQIMIFGQDFNSVTVYQRAFEAGTEVETIGAVTCALQTVHECPMPGTLATIRAVSHFYRLGALHPSNVGTMGNCALDDDEECVRASVDRSSTSDLQRNFQGVGQRRPICHVIAICSEMAREEGRE